MKTIWLKDLKLKEKVVEKVVKNANRKPLFLWMKEKDIYRIEYLDGFIYWYNKDWLEIYYENSDGYLRKIEDWKRIENTNWKYYIDWKEAELI